MEPIEHINYTETGIIPTQSVESALVPFCCQQCVETEKECTYYHELNYTEWCQFSQNEPTCTLDDVFVQ